MTIRRVSTVLFASMVLLAGSAEASILSLSAKNAALAGFTGPFADLTVTRTGNDTATIFLQALTSGTTGYLFSDGATLALNVNGGGLSYSSLITTQPVGISGGLGVPGYTQKTNENADGFGKFNFLLDQTGGQNSQAAVRTLGFTLTKTSGPAWVGDNDVLMLNNKSHLAAAHVFTYKIEAGDFYSTLGQVTGYAGDGENPSPGDGDVPEPATLGIWGIALCCSAVARFRSRRRKIT